MDALLADRTNLIGLKPTFCLEIGCGSGYVITSLAIMLKSGIGGGGTQFFATDINTQAAETTTSTLQSHGVHADIIATDLASGLQKRMEGMVDVIVVNPPYVPTPEDEVGCDGITASWAGGLNGRSVIDRILPIAHKLLSDKGWLYMVTLTANNPMQICRVMSEYGYSSRIVVQRSTEEESLHVIKFWRDSSKGSAASTSNEGCSSSSWLSLLSFSSFWKNSSRH